MLRYAVALSATHLLIATVSPHDAFAAQTSPLSETFIAGDSLTPMEFAAWDVSTDAGSQTHTVRGQLAVDQAPSEASRYTQKSYVFPTGSIHVLEFKKDHGGMRHALTDETTLYMLKGEGQVEVAGKVVSIKEKDVVSHPSGTLRGDGDATVVLWVVTGTKNNAKPMVVRAADTTFGQMGYWYKPDGERVLVTTAEELKDAPANAIRLDMTNYAFDGNGLVVTKNYKSGPTNKTRGDRDALLYIVSGQMNFFQDDIDVIAGPGDAIRETAGRYHNWIRLEDSSFLGIGTAPLVALEPDAQSDY